MPAPSILTITGMTCSLACFAGASVWGHLHRDEVGKTALLAASGWCALTLALGVWDLLGFTTTDGSTWVLLIQMIGSLLVWLAMTGPRIRRILGPYGNALRPLAVACAIPLGFWLVEWPYNPSFLQIPQSFAFYSMTLVGLAVLSIWFLGQRTHLALLAGPFTCLVLGLTDFFLLTLKGQVVMPADILSLSTAANVGAGYDYILDVRPLQAFAGFMAFGALVTIVPRSTHSPRIVAICLLTGILCASLLSDTVKGNDYSEEGIHVDFFHTAESYERYGALPCFINLMHQIDPRLPWEYSTSVALEVLADNAGAWDADHPGYDEDAASLATSDDAPTIIAIMDESFCDLTVFPGFEGYDGPVIYDGIGRLWGGSTYVCALGGGTCNSEFEFLTGSSCGFLGAGVYPYVYYDLSRAQTTPHLLGTYGYQSTAIHPEDPTNWHRDRVFTQMGFDEFLSIGDFDDPTLLRGKVSDADCFDKVLDLLDSDDSRRFIFTVTMQNHGGYLTGELDTSAYDDVTVMGNSIEGLPEYLTCNELTQKALVDFLDELTTMDRKVIVVFFGDHEPSFTGMSLTEAAFGDEPTEEEANVKWMSSYMVWANYEVDAQRLSEIRDPSLNHEGTLHEGDIDTSLMYLMANVTYAAGLPLTEHQKALLNLRPQVPAINLGGYMDGDGEWHGIWEHEVGDAFWQLEVLQYAQLFDEGFSA